MAPGTEGPRVVIGIPLYNGARFFDSALASLLRQDGVPFALVLVDDDSTDETPVLARRLADRDARVIFHRNDRRLGLSGNWQRCFELACRLHPGAEFFAWGSDHDLWEPGWMEALVDALDDDSRCVLAYPQMMRISKHGEDRKPVAPFETRGVSSSLRRFIRAGVGMSAGNIVYGMFRVDALREAGGFPTVLLPDRLLLLRMSLLGEFHQLPHLLWRRRLVGGASLQRQRQTMFPGGAPWSASLPVELAHAATIFRGHALRRGTVSRPVGAAATLATILLRVASKPNRRRMRRLRLRLWRARKRVRRAFGRSAVDPINRLRLRLWRARKRVRRTLGRSAVDPINRLVHASWHSRQRSARAIRAAVGVLRGSYVDLSGHDLPIPSRPSAEAIAAAAEGSRLRCGPAFTDSACGVELRFREEIEPCVRVENVTDWLARKEVLPKLAYVLKRAGVEPHGVVVELGAGSCWLSAALASRTAVDRVVSVEFSRRRLEDLAPTAIAALGAPAEKIERVLADFNASGLPPESADLVVSDAAFHHASDPMRLTRAAFDLLRPDGTLLLFREPTLAAMRRTRDHGLEGLHGDFEREDTRRGYRRQLRDAGFVDVRDVPAPGSLTKRRGRFAVLPPLSFLNGIAFAEFAYVARRPAERAGEADGG